MSGRFGDRVRTAMAMGAVRTPTQLSKRVGLSLQTVGH